jgi:hypothetical protein
MRARERIIRERFADQKCAHCGSPYPGEGVVILARRSSTWMVMASCANCQRRSVFVVSFPPQPADHAQQSAHSFSFDTPIDVSPIAPVTPIAPAVSAPPASPERDSDTPYAPSPSPEPERIPVPISAADVNMIHEFLTTFDGDFRKLFRKPE